ncbi:MAG: thermonuclease family protein [Pseudomonadota bacterium]
MCGPNHPLTRRSLSAALMLVAVPAQACLVAGVQDGDTLSVVCDGRKMTVDLAEIDAPELGQDFGTRSRQSLSDMCYRREARLVNPRARPDGRVVAQVYCDGVPASAEQLRRGMAWVAEDEVDDQTLYVAQHIAQHARRGLWSGENPVAPWEWRRVALRTEQAARAKAARRAPPKEEPPDNAFVAFFKRLFGQ